MAQEENQQELLFKFSLFERQITEIQQQIEAVEKGIIELETLNFGLDSLVGKTDTEIFAPIGKGIFVKAKLISETLNVDIGQGNFIQKSIPETKTLIEEQIQKLKSIKKELEQNLEELGEQITKIMNEANSSDCECNCGEDCSCKQDKDECDCGRN